MFSIVKPVPFCVDCKHFKPPTDGIPPKYGYCKKFFNVNTVDGSVEYSFASVARIFECRDKYYEPKDFPDTE